MVDVLDSLIIIPKEKSICHERYSKHAVDKAVAMFADYHSYAFDTV